jgi:uncharacterized protein YbbK (DUF523 family)
MKCPDCGGTQIHMYKEIRQLIAEMGFTKEGIQEEINRTIDSMVEMLLISL